MTRPRMTTVPEEFCPAGHRVLVCGGRAYADQAHLAASLELLHAARPFTLLIHGAAPGADSLAAGWANEHGLAVRAFPAAWDLHGKAAGPLRNQQMLDEGRPDLVVAFMGGRGTADMVERATLAGVPVLER